MRTENPTVLATTVTRIRTQLVRARRSVWARGPAVRWLAVLGTLAAIAAVGYVATIPSAGKFLGAGHQYPAEDLARITHALEGQHIEYRVEDHRIGVSADHYDEATDVVAKLDIGPRSIAEIRKQAQDSHPWDTQNEREQRDLKAREQILERMIGSLDEGNSIVSTFVKINRTPVRIGIRQSTAATAFVWLETRDGRELRPKTVQSIMNMIVASEPDMKSDAVTVIDKNGHRYLDPGNPELNELSRIRAREEEISQEILEHLYWIKGVRVTVQNVPKIPMPRSLPPVAAVEMPDRVEEPRVAANQPLELMPEPRPVAAAAAPRRSPPAPPKPADEPSFHKIWVKVPRSFYLKSMPNRNPSMEDLYPFQMKTESVIKTAAGYVIVPPNSFEVLIDTIPDDVVLRDPLVAPAVPETRRPPSWWIPAGVGGMIAAAALAVGLRLLATRRPRRAVAIETARDRFASNADSESGPGPSERVRELIRHNPKAAASVLHRWIGQGGHPA